MKLLTVVSTILLPATLIVGFFGTGFASLHSQGYLYVMLVLLLALPCGVVFAFRRANMI